MYLYQYIRFSPTLQKCKKIQPEQYYLENGFREFMDCYKTLFYERSMCFIGKGDGRLVKSYDKIIPNWKRVYETISKNNLDESIKGITN